MRLYVIFFGLIVAYISIAHGMDNHQLFKDYSSPSLSTRKDVNNDIDFGVAMEITTSFGESFFDIIINPTTKKIATAIELAAPLLLAYKVACIIDPKPYN